MSFYGVLTGVALFGVFVLVVVAVGRPFHEVSRARLERFAYRQSLHITPENGARVIAYLATTRRWRGGLLLAGLALSSVVSTAHRTGSTNLDFTVGFLGWFVGAVIAEWRVGTGSRDGVRRAASLAPRRLGDYVPISLRILAIGGFLAVCLFDARALLRHDGQRFELAMLLLITLATGGVIAVVARHVLRRPQVLASTDVVAADDALRSRSLRVLLGSGLALAGYLLSLADSVASSDSVHTGPHSTSPLAAVGILLFPIAGWVLATTQARTRGARSAEIRAA